MTEEEKNLAKDLQESIEEEMLRKLKEYEKQIEENDERYKRLYAEFDNYKKRTEKEKLSTMKIAKGSVIESIIPVLDAMEHAILAETEDTKYKEGILLISEQLKLFLEKNGVKEIGKEGENFNPEYHDAVVMAEKEGMKEGLVINVLRKGYMIEDKVLRHAMVSVSK